MFLFLLVTGLINGQFILMILTDLSCLDGQLASLSIFHRRPQSIKHFVELYPVEDTHVPVAMEQTYIELYIMFTYYGIS